MNFKIFASLLLFAGLLAMVSCDDSCLLMVFRQCVVLTTDSNLRKNGEIASDSNSIYGKFSCSSLDTIKTCVNSLRKNCPTESTEDKLLAFDTMRACITSGRKNCTTERTESVDKLLAPLEEICKPGTELNKKYVEQEQCLDNVISGDASPCFAGLIEGMNNIPQPPSLEDAKRVLKLICESTPKAMNCLYGKAEEKCTTDGRDVATAFAEPALKTLQKICSNRPSGASAISGFSWVVLLSTALLLSIWH